MWQLESNVDPEAEAEAEPYSTVRYLMAQLKMPCISAVDHRCLMHDVCLLLIHLVNPQVHHTESLHVESSVYNTPNSPNDMLSTETLRLAFEPCYFPQERIQFLRF